METRKDVMFDWGAVIALCFDRVPLLGLTI